MEESNDAVANESSLEVEPSKKVTSFFGETVVKTEEFVYTWTIRNLSHFYVEDAKIESPVFTTEVKDAEIKWYLSFFPNGRGEETTEGYASLELLQTDPSEDVAATVYFKFFILVQKEGYFQEELLDENYVEFGDFFDLESEKIYNVDNFLEKVHLNRYLHNGNLTIRCRIYSYLGATESDVSKTPITRTENQEVMENRRRRELEDFGKFFENEKFSDVTLAIGEEKFLAHKNVLSARSRVFAAMFEHNMIENNENLVTIVDIESKVMKEVLRFIYLAKVENLDSMSKELLAAADKYELNGLKIMCEETLIEKLSDKTVGETLLLADRHDAEKLRTATLEFIMIHACELATTNCLDEAIKSLSPALVSTVVKTLMLKM